MRWPRRSCSQSCALFFIWPPLSPPPSPPSLPPPPSSPPPPFPSQPPLSPPPLQPPSPSTSPPHYCRNRRRHFRTTSASDLASATISATDRHRIRRRRLGPPHRLCHHRRHRRLRRRHRPRHRRRPRYRRRPQSITANVAFCRRRPHPLPTKARAPPPAVSTASPPEVLPRLSTLPRARTSTHPSATRQPHGAPRPLTHPHLPPHHTLALRPPRRLPPNRLWSLGPCVSHFGN